jgi:general secretion pathway protein G
MDRLEADRLGRGVRRAGRGFSLLELSLVIVIIGLLMGVAAFSLVGGQKRAAIKTTKATLNQYKTAIQQFTVDHAGTPPAALTDLVAGSAPYLEPNNAGQPPSDAWDQQLFYAVPGPNGRPFALMSAGPDKQFRTEDDIDLWSVESAAAGG